MDEMRNEIKLGALAALRDARKERAERECRSTEGRLIGSTSDTRRKDVLGGHQKGTPRRAAATSSVLITSRRRPNELT